MDTLIDTPTGNISSRMMKYDFCVSEYIDSFSPLESYSFIIECIFTETMYNIYYTVLGCFILKFIVLLDTTILFNVVRL